MIVLATLPIAATACSKATGNNAGDTTGAGSAANSTGITGATGDTANTGNTGSNGTVISIPPPPPTTTTTTTPPSITLTITGEGPALQVTTDLDGQESQHTQVSLPWTEMIPTGPRVVVLGAQTTSGDPNATLTCSIQGPPSAFGAAQPTTNTSTGPYTTVECVKDFGF